MAENGKIRFPKSGDPSIPPPTGSFYTWLSTEGFFKKMDDQGNVTNLSAQSLHDLPELDVGDATDGQILVFNGDTDVWESVDFPDVGSSVDSVNGHQGIVVLSTDDLDDSSSSNKFISQSQLNQIATNSGDIVSIQSGKIDDFLTGIDSNRQYIFQRTSFNGVYTDDWVRRDLLISEAVSAAAADLEDELDLLHGEGAVSFDSNTMAFKLNLLQDDEPVNYSLDISGAYSSAFDLSYSSPEWNYHAVPFDVDLMGTDIKFKPNEGTALMYVNGDRLLAYCDEIAHWIFVKLTTTFDFNNPEMGIVILAVDHWTQLGTGVTTLTSGTIVPDDPKVTFTGTSRDGSYVVNTPAGFGVKAVKQLSQAEEGVLLDSKTIKQELDKKVEEDNIYDFVRMKSINGSVWKLSVNDSGGVVVSPE